MQPSQIKPYHDEGWLSFVNQFRSGSTLKDSAWATVFAPLQRTLEKPSMLVGQLGQSLDGRIATVTGHSKYINGQDGLEHLHRLRALMDGVLIGVATAITDDPLLTVRQVSGPHPARIVIDPSGRLPASAKVWNDDGVRRIIITAQDTNPRLPVGVEHITIALKNKQIDPTDTIQALAQRGIKSILVEGGANTIARFLTSGQLDRLHLIVAPIILGSGRTGLNLHQIQSVDEAIRPKVTPHLLGGEVLFDCAFNRLT
jgi:diaminohydroxyphosphoribosylaminopyrimidine deaminase/5-amino-6-(5-phosphoribosylamino)uracil reductase